MSAGVTERQVVVEGRSARVFVGGDAAAVTVLLLHGGWGGAAMHWSRVWDRLAERFFVVAPDLPGIGDVDQPGRARLAEYVAWLDALLGALGVSGSVIVVGNSFGASLAWSFAGRRPERCAGVVLVDGIPMPRTPGPMLWLGRRRLGRALMRRALRRVSFTPEALPKGFADPRRAPAELGALAETPQRRLETFLDCVIEGDGPPAPRAPILVLWGEADRLPGTSLAAGRKLAARLGAGFSTVADAGHFPQLERPEAFVDAVAGFAAP